MSIDDIKAEINGNELFCADAPHLSEAWELRRTALALAAAVEAVLALADEYGAAVEPDGGASLMLARFVAVDFRRAVAAHLDPKENPNG